MSPIFKNKGGAQKKKNILLREKKKKREGEEQEVGVINRLCLLCYKLQQEKRVVVFIQGCGIGLQG
jgi:hypothetical protein